MLTVESVYWATTARAQLIKKLSALGFLVEASRRDSHTHSVFFGPEAIEVFEGTDQLTAYNDSAGVNEFLKSGDGIFAVGLESRDLAADYTRLQALGAEIEMPRGAKTSDQNIPLWFGFNVPKSLAPGVNAWTVMNSPAVLAKQSAEILPLSHPNTCFGIEGVHLTAGNPKDEAAQWTSLLGKPNAGVKWNELEKTEGRRIQTGDRFFDIVSPKGKLQAKHAVFMVTLKVTDLELAKQICEKAGAIVTSCSSRDGFVVAGTFTGGPALRFVRSFWKRYQPAVITNYPMGRRADAFRPLGGTNTTTLTDGFQDNWKY